VDVHQFLDAGRFEWDQEHSGVWNK
jgi:hypothetical protein